MKSSPYILRFDPIFIKKNNDINNSSLNSFEKLIKKSIYLCFKKLSNEIDLNIMQTPLTNRCDLVRNELGKIMESYGFNVKMLETQDVLGDDVLGHSLLIVEGFKDNLSNNDMTYLIDPTYSQFFLKEKCSSDEYMIFKDMVVKSPDPGYYYLANEDKQDIAVQLLENGFIKLTEKTCKAYADSFYTTKRGREALLNFDNPPNISGETYLKWFLKDNVKCATR